MFCVGGFWIFLRAAVAAMATSKRKAEEDAERDDPAGKLARLPEPENDVEDDAAAAEDGEEEPAANGNGNRYVACLHEVSYPEGYDHANGGERLAPAKPAKEYPFTLDPFQREAIRCLEAGESVLVNFL